MEEKNKRFGRPKYYADFITNVFKMVFSGQSVAYFSLGLACNGFWLGAACQGYGLLCEVGDVPGITAGLRHLLKHRHT